MAPERPSGPRPLMTAQEPRLANQNLLQIGEVADRVGLSLRTVRYYEEVGLLTPTARSEGGFRLYGEDQVERLALIKQMKPIGTSLEEMRTMLDARSTLSGDGTEEEKDQARQQLQEFLSMTEKRSRLHETQIEIAHNQAEWMLS